MPPCLALLLCSSLRTARFHDVPEPLIRWQRPYSKTVMVWKEDVTQLKSFLERSYNTCSDRPMLSHVWQQMHGDLLLRATDTQQLTQTSDARMHAAST